MATTIESIEILQEYLKGVLDRANHHAQNVNSIALAIAGGIIWRSTNRIKVLSREGDMKNVLWLEVNQIKLCFVYDHLGGNIDIRETSIQGKTIKSFNNNTPLDEVKTFFESI
jgi:hypothetical protein